MIEKTTHSGFRECPRCGAATPIERAECEQCGFNPARRLAEFQESARAQGFIHAMASRSGTLTYLFIGINVGLFALMWTAGGMGLASADTRVLINFGAKFNPQIDQLGQYWRLITSMFLHIGLLHLALNNYALWIVGQELEKLYGSARFAVIYTLTGLTGSIASYFYYPESVSAGASGALFGLFGALAAFAFKPHPDVPDQFRRAIIRRVIPVIVLNLVLSFSVSEIDKAAHIGGLIAGIALGLVISHMRVEERASPQPWRALMIICLVLILVSFVAAFINYQARGL